MSARSEFDVLRASHRFLRDDADAATSWDDQLAKRYYDSLWKEFAVCDLKHYKSGNFALRWRTEAEVLSGAGEASCANTRCPLHPPPASGAPPLPGLATLELPFAYDERGARRSALVKVVLCARCVRRLLWKRTREKARARGDADDGPRAEGEAEAARERGTDDGENAGDAEDEPSIPAPSTSAPERPASSGRAGPGRRIRGDAGDVRRARSSRSRSPAPRSRPPADSISDARRERVR